MANSSNLPEDEQRLFDERARVRSADPNCTPVESVPTPELTPVEPVGKCDEPATPLVEPFIPPNRPPDQPSDPDLLPPSILLYSREASAECPVGQVELSGVTPYPFIVAAGEEVQEVYLDDIVIIVDAVETSIPQSELFRLSAYSAAMQAYATADLIAAIDLADFTAFDAGFVALTGVSLPVAEAIRAALVVGQTAADDIAQASAEAILVCGWRNQELWVVCNPDPESPGYTILYAEPVQPDPPEPPIEFEHVAAGLAATLDDPETGYKSTVSQEDADTIAATYAAFELECLVGNVEQLATCYEEEILDEETEIVWPLTADWDDNPVLPFWMLPKENLVTKNPDPLSLDKQVADTWDSTPEIWQLFNHPYNLEPLELYKLDGQEFITYSKVGTALRRTLRTRVVVLANTVFARTQEEADQTAKAQAVEQLDCFFPNRPLIVTCLHSTHGSSAVLARATALGLDNDEEDDRPAMYAELNAGGDGSDYPPLNTGVTDYDTYPDEQADSTRAFEVWVWPGFFAEDSEAATLAVALNYAREHLLCEWVSPLHECHCITPEAEDVEQDVGFLHQQDAPGDVDVSGLWQQYLNEFTILDAPNGSPVDVRLDPLRSVHENTLPRGLFRSPTYPNEVAGFDSAYGWPELPQICQNALECFFLACKLACCEAKPDMRPLLVNEMPNYASVTSGAHSTQTQHLVWMANWWYELSLRGIGACALAPGGPESFKAAEFDACAMETTDEFTISPYLNRLAEFALPTGRDIVHPGPNNGEGPGMPARFKFGGTLAWGYQWAPPVLEFDPEDPFAIGGPPGTVKNCHVSGGGGPTQAPDPWGFFSCAEGKAEGYAPLQLPKEAQQAAIARLDCTHIAWPRHLVTCPQPNQKPWGGGASLNVIAEGSDTGAADLAVEMMLLPLLDCRDMHNFMLTFNGADLSLPGPSAVVVGKADTECMPLGLNAVKLYDPDDCNQEVDTQDITLIDGGHVIISAKCCEGQIVKRLSLHIIEDNTVTYEMIRDAKQKGELGIQKGRDEAEIIRALPGVREVFYIGSYHITDMGGGSFRSIACQAYSGPVVLHETCCDGSSASDGDGSSAGGSFGSDSGSDKSTAIVPAAWSPTGYTALFTDESPEVVFHDTVKVQMKPLGRRITRVKIDPRFLSVCEAGHVWASGYSCDSVQGMSVRVVGDEVVIRRSWLNCASEVIVTLTGVRRGFRGLRFPNRTREQFVANEAFINSAYPAR